MGQPNAKDQRRRRPAAGTATPDPRGGVRPSAMNDAVLRTDAPAPASASASPNSNRQSPAVAGVTPNSGRHVDPKASPNGSLDMPSPASRTSFARQSPSASNIEYPIVLRYKETDTATLLSKKATVYVAVEAMNWKPITMSPSSDSFYALLELPAGNHNYRFIVDGNEVVDSTQPLAPKEEARAPTATATGTVQQQKEISPAVGVALPLPRPTPCRDGKPANTIFLDDTLLATREDDDVMDNGQGWGQEEVMFEESRKYPPIIPLHLRYTPLNTPPTLVRCSRDGKLTVGGDPENEGPRSHPEHLPLPLSVTINHVYFQRREDHAVMGVTMRYCNKFTTVVYYTHMPANPVDSS